jgi:hypothetical protein
MVHPHPLCRPKPHEWIMYFMLMASGMTAPAMLVMVGALGAHIAIIEVEIDREDEDGS